MKKLLLIILLVCYAGTKETNKEDTNMIPEFISFTEVNIVEEKEYVGEKSECLLMFEKYNIDPKTKSKRGWSKIINDRRLSLFIDKLEEKDRQILISCIINNSTSGISKGVKTNNKVESKDNYDFLNIWNFQNN